MAKLNPEVKTKWLTALRSGEYKQTQEILAGETKEGDMGYCCLGVLCDLALKEGVLPEDMVQTIERYPITGRMAKSYAGAMTVLPEIVFNWAVEDPENQLEYANLRVKTHFAGNYRDNFLLSELNDGSGYNNVPPHTFAEIADLIEEHL